MKIFVKSIFLVTFMFCLYNKAMAFYCGNNLVSEGNTTAEVIQKCGAPMWKERHEEIFIEGLDSDKERRKTIIIEEWTYNFGKDRWI
ncbi:MAG: DUF2845 domain-containing protein, partial [Thermodesulfovibrionales bacterium]